MTHRRRALRRPRPRPAHRLRRPRHITRRFRQRHAPGRSGRRHPLGQRHPRRRRPLAGHHQRRQRHQHAARPRRRNRPRFHTDPRLARPLVVLPSEARLNVARSRRERMASTAHAGSRRCLGSFAVMRQVEERAGAAHRHPLSARAAYASVANFSTTRITDHPAAPCLGGYRPSGAKCISA